MQVLSPVLKLGGGCVAIRLFRKASCLVLEARLQLAIRKEAHHQACQMPCAPGGQGIEPFLFGGGQLSR